MSKPAIQVSYLDGLRFERALLAGLKEILAHEEHLNKINVFPIPDNDTGSNLKKTIVPVMDNYPLLEPLLDKCSRLAADLATEKAMGYSGIIFSHFLLGFAEGVQGATRIYPPDIARAVGKGVERAYESLSNPVEGTVLTVLREWADELARLAAKTEDFVILLKESCRAAYSSLQRTPEQLEVLRKHKVVDGGGQAFLYFLEGIIKLIEKGKLVSPALTKRKVRLRQERDEGREQFCAECCVRKANLDRISLHENISALGSDLIFYSSLNFAKLHVRTGNPEEVFSCAAQFGEVSAKKIYKFAPDLPFEERKALALASDTTCDISGDYIEDNDVYFIPVKFQALDRVFTDKVDVIPEDFYEILMSSPTHPTTSQPSLADFTKFFKHLLVHYQAVISFHVSGALSGTFQTGLQAAQQVDPRRISVLDGKNISIGLGIAMVEGIKAVRDGLSQKDVLGRLQEAIDNIRIFIGIPTLKYLVKGGRVTKVKGFIASLLNINPILSINTKGALEPVGKTRGKKDLESKVLDLVTDIISKEGSAEFSMAVAHTNAPELGKKVAERIERKLGKAVVLVENASPVLGAHAGPGAVGIGYLRKKQPGGRSLGRP